MKSLRLVRNDDKKAKNIMFVVLKKISICNNQLPKIIWMDRLLKQLILLNNQIICKKFNNMYSMVKEINYLIHLTKIKRHRTLLDNGYTLLDLVNVIGNSILMKGINYRNQNLVILMNSIKIVSDKIKFNLQSIFAYSSLLKSTDIQILKRTYFLVLIKM